jgi:hypothetical protein
MHGINISFGKDRGGGGNDWENEDLVSLAHITSFSIPVNITDHAGLPKALTDISFGSIEGLVTK